MHFNSILVRQEQSVDYSAVFSIHEQAFGRTYEANLVNRLRSSPAFIPELSLVALVGAKLVGHILFTRIWIKNGAADHLSLAMGPVSVLPALQNSGVGSALIRSGLALATQLDYASVTVLGHDHYYPRFGFTPAEKWGIQCPFEVPSSFFMALELRADALEKVSGVVQYASEFTENSES